MVRNMKTAVLGYSGSGKSTLAKQLAEHYGVPVLYLDTVQYLPGWKKRGREESRSIVSAFMRDNASWVIDGNYGGFLQEERLRQADRIILLLFPRRICFFRAWKRSFRNRGKTRESMADGCAEKMDMEFARWILFEGRTKKKRKHYRESASLYSDKTLVLKTPGQVREFLEQIVPRETESP